MNELDTDKILRALIEKSFYNGIGEIESYIEEIEKSFDTARIKLKNGNIFTVSVTDISD